MSNSDLLSFRKMYLSPRHILGLNSQVDRDFFEKIKIHAVGMKNDWRPAIGASFKDQSFQALSMKRGIAKNCSFYNCDFRRVAGTGSHWSKSKFINCDFGETNFDYADFKNTDFVYDKIPFKTEHHGGPGFIGASFSGASFKNSSLQNVYARGTSLSKIDFSDSRLLDCHIQSCTLEGSNFSNAKISNMSFDRINIEYCDFKNAIFDNVNIALMQFPYVFGINEETIRSGSLGIQTDDTNNFVDGILPWNDLLKIIPYLVSYYLSNQNYFPICNLYLASKRYEEFVNYLNLGIRHSMIQGDFRTIKFLCKLANTSGLFSNDELYELYVLIKLTYVESINDTFITHSYHMHEGEIRRELLPLESEELIKLEIILSSKSEKSTLVSINNCLNTLALACKSLGLMVSWNKLTATQNSPIRISVNITVNNTNNNEKKKETKTNFIHIISVVFTGMSAAFAGASATALWYDNLTDFEKKPIVQAQHQIDKNFIVHSISMNQGSRLYLSVNNGVIESFNLENIDKDNTVNILDP